MVRIPAKKLSALRLDPSRLRDSLPHENIPCSPFHSRFTGCVGGRRSCDRPGGRRLYALTLATVRIEVGNGPIIYIDPTGINTTPADADFVLLTHNHGDHQSVAVLSRLRKPSTVFVSSPPGVPALQQGLAGATIHSVTPGRSSASGASRWKRSRCTTSSRPATRG
ncbi:MAG: MBL fold metallo-hydrolase [Opitutus sp.]|nr:MBL fold metallo-hydrolase [Opitutus sp.]